MAETKSPDEKPSGAVKANFRESLRALLHFERPSEICQFEWGYWPETIKRWQSEGLVGDRPWEAAGITYYDRVPVEARFCPAFETIVIEETESTRVVRDSMGVVKEESKTATALPRYLKHPVESIADFEALKERLDPTTPARFPTDWQTQAAALGKRTHVLVMGGCEISFFGWHRDLMGVENLMVSYYTQPELIHAISRHHLAFVKELYSRILRDVTYDFVFVWEDMSYKNGPLISPELVREFMLPCYRELVGFFREFGDYRFLLDSDGDVTRLIPLFREAGIDGMLPFEVAAGMDVVAIGKQYGDLVICGGIDKREIAKGRAAIDRELERVLPAMFRRGGYLPSMDHHVPPDVSWADFLYYLERTRELYDVYGR